MSTAMTPEVATQAPPGGGRRRIWLAVLVLVALASVAVGAGVWFTRSGGADDGTAVAPSAAPSAEPSAQPGVLPGASGPATPAAADCAVPPEQQYFTVGASHACFAVMGQRLVVWLGEAVHRKGDAYEPSTTFSAADVTNVRAVQLLMDDRPDGWLGPDEWARLMGEDPPPVTELRASGIGALWFGMTAQQAESTGLARVHIGDAEEPGNHVEVLGIVGAGCIQGTPPGGRLTTFWTTDPRVSTPDGITPTSTVADLTRVYGNRLTSRVAPSTPRDLTIYTVVDGDFALAFWAPEPDVGPDSPLVLYAGTREEIAGLHPQSGWCFD